MTGLKVLLLAENQFSGTLSTKIGRLVALQEFSVERSGLSGEIPGSLGNLKSLEQVYLQFNAFQGAVPEALCEIPTLVDLQADCDGSEKLECVCCTQCCSIRKTNAEIQNRPTVANRSPAYHMGWMLLKEGVNTSTGIL